MPSEMSVSDGLKDIIEQMLKKDPNERITIEQLKQNAWLNEGFHVSLDSKAANLGLMSHYKAQDNKDIPISAIEYAN